MSEDDAMDRRHSFSELLAEALSRCGASANDPALRAEQAREMVRHCERIVALAQFAGTSAQVLLLREILRSILSRLEEPSLASMGSTVDAVAIPPTAELVQWARQEFSDEEITAGVNEIERTGGRELREFIGELETIASTHE